MLLGGALYGAMLILKRFPVHMCGHQKNPISAGECLHSFLKASPNQHYFLATQDPALTANVHKLAYVPLIYIKVNTIVLEKPSYSAMNLAQKTQTQNSEIVDKQMETLKKIKEIEFGPEETGPKGKKKRKGPKGPNPLSCKKKAKKKTSGEDKQGAGKQGKSRKRHKKIPEHIQRMFDKIEAECGPGKST